MPVPQLASDANVPEAHAGLHGFLYNVDASQEHGSSSGGERYALREGEDDGSIKLPVPIYLSFREGHKLVGVYALYDDSQALQYVGYARNLVSAIKRHMSLVGEQRCAWVRAKVVTQAGMTTRTRLEAEADEWMQREAAPGLLPPGNGEERDLWEGRSQQKLPASVLPDAQLGEYEEKKLKLRKAMGENLGDDAAKEGKEGKEDSRLRRLKMIAAMEGDEWSAVIDGQSLEDVVEGRTSSSGQQPTTAASSNGAMVSPFAQPGGAQLAAERAGGASAAPTMTVESVDRVLDEVRPYLLADGGNVTVVSVDGGRVLVEMQGACGSCTSSAATLKGGIETSLRAAFGEQLVEVAQVNGPDDAGASVSSVDAHLDMLRPAIQGYGGSVQVLFVGDGRCKLRYIGPAPIATGIMAAIKDKFPDINEVEFVEDERAE